MKRDLVGLGLVLLAGCGRIGYEVVLSGNPDAAGTGGEVADGGGGSGAASTDAPAMASAPVHAPCPWPGPDRLLAEWHADGTTENRVVCSPWQARVQGVVPYGPGRSGQAWQFRSRGTGSDPNHVSVPGTVGYVAAGLTVDVWVYQTGFNAFGGSQRFIAGTAFPGFGTGGPGNWHLYVHENGDVFFLVQTGAGADDAVLCYVPDSRTLTETWVRYTATFDGSMARCYLNGSLVHSRAAASRSQGPLEALSIGRNYPGDIDHLRLFDRALSPAEIAQPWP